MCEFVVGEGVFEGFPHGALGGVGYGFVEVDDLAGKLVELGAFNVSIHQCLVVVAGGGDSKVVDVDGSVDERVGVEAFEENGEKGVDRKNTEGATLEECSGGKGVAADAVELEETEVV